MKKSFALLLFFIVFGSLSFAQDKPGSSSVALSPARFELELRPGSETTVLINVDFRSEGPVTQPVRLVASLSDWDMTVNGQVQYFPANSQPNSASPWLVFSPAEAAVVPGTVHQIRVTVSVPADARPGDHLTALVVEQRPESPKTDPDNKRKLVVRYRMASVFYIKVLPGLIRKGELSDLYAESTSTGLLVTPTFKNSGNSMVRPTAAVSVVDVAGHVVAEMSGLEPFPVLAGAELKQPVTIEKPLEPGKYIVKYLVDFRDGKKAVEGVTDLIIKPVQTASVDDKPKKP